MNWINAQVVDSSTAKLFIKRLQANKLIFHFDDGAVECLYGNGVVTREQADTIDRRVDEIYALELDWGEFGCPIGYCLHVMGE